MVSVPRGSFYASLKPFFFGTELASAEKHMRRRGHVVDDPAGQVGYRRNDGMFLQGPVFAPVDEAARPDSTFGEHRPHLLIKAGIVATAFQYARIQSWRLPGKKARDRGC